MFEAARLAMMAEYEQNMNEAENMQQQNNVTGNVEDTSCLMQLPDELADNDDYDQQLKLITNHKWIADRGKTENWRKPEDLY